MKTLLVTGGTGFTGSNFINYVFEEEEYKIINLDDISYCNNIDKGVQFSENYIFINGTVCSENLLAHILKSYKVDEVLHFTAHSQEEDFDSVQFTKDTILGTHILLECCKKYGNIKKFIHVTSVQGYEKQKTEPSNACPNDAIKAGAELIVESYHNFYTMPVILIRESNAYGPNQNSRELIHRFIKKLESNEKLIIEGDGSTAVPLLHVQDTIRAIQCILKKGVNGETYNIGGNKAYSVMEIATILIKIMKDTENYDEWITYVEDKTHNHHEQYYINTDKVKNLGWDIQISLQDGLQELIWGKYKIKKHILNELNNANDNKKYFGDWIKDIHTLKTEYANALPFEHIKIDNFLQEEYAEEIFKNFPTDFETWHKYYNPIEFKYANDNINNMNKPTKELFYLLSTNQLLNIFSNITGIKDLEFDPYLHGAGLHTHPRYGRLNMHLDYEKHIMLKTKQRRLNVILFFTKDWKEEWNGDNQLWSNDMKECVVKTYPKFNSAIIFKTDEITWHGLPEKIMCPEGIFRKSFAYYYISPLVSNSSENKIGNDGSGYRTKATFVKRPTDPVIPELEKLYKIRPYRRIEKRDMEEIWPEWTPELF